MSSHVPRIPLVYSPLTSRQARVRGVLLVIVGLILTALAAVIMAFFLGLISPETFFPGVYRDPDTADKPIHVAAWAFVSFFGLFGLLSIAEGIWQIWLGRRNKYLMIVMIAMAILFVAAGVLARGLRHT